VELQATLLAKVASYDRNMSARAGDRARVLLLFNDSDAESLRFATRMQLALQALSQVGGLPHEERLHAFNGSTELQHLCQRDRIAIIIVAPGLGEHVGAIRDALDGINVLSVAATPAYVPEGVVLGFDLVSSKPKLLVHLTRARRQGVDLPAEVLKLMRVYE
ncbi:MAG: YfiR family protein, partial [Polyangiaceae bacterium]